MTGSRLLLAGALLAPVVVSWPSQAATCRTLPREVTRGAVVRVCEQHAWLHAPADAAGRVGNVAGAAHTAGVGTASYATWSALRPSESLTAGGGAADVAHPAGALLGPAAAATFSGTVAGPLDNVAFDLYVVLPARASDPSRTAAVAIAHAGAPELPVSIRFVVDGFAVTREVDLWLYRSPDVASRVLFKGKLAFTGLYRCLDAARARHSLLLELVPAELHHDESVFLYDAAEVPSAVTFNATSLAGYSRVVVR